MSQVTLVCQALKVTADRRVIVVIKESPAFLANLAELVSVAFLVCLDQEASLECKELQENAVLKD